MADYDLTALTNTRLAHKKPGTVQMMRALRDNLIAALAGETGAPRLYLRSLEGVTAGAELRATKTAGAAVEENGQTEWAFTVLQSGTLRLEYQHRKNTGVGNSEAEVRVYRAGSLFATVMAYATSSTSYVTRTGDVTVVAGDRIEMFHTGSAAGTFSQMTNMKISTGGEDLFPGEGLGGYIVGNRAAT